MEGTASDSAQGLSSSLHQEPDHAKDLEVVAKFGGDIWCFFLALRDLMLFPTGVDQTAKLSAVVLTSGEQTLLPSLHSSYSPNHKPAVLDPKPSALRRSFPTDLNGIWTLNKPETEISRTQRPPRFSLSTGSVGQDADVDITELSYDAFLPQNS